jgi:hypothetical protein
MARWLVLAVLLWLAVLTVLTLIALFRHSSSQHSQRPVAAAAH